MKRVRENLFVVMQGIGIGCNACAGGDHLSLELQAAGKDFAVQVAWNGGAHAHRFIKAGTEVFAAGEFRSRLNFVDGCECGEKFVFEGVVGVRVVSNVEAGGRDGRCGCVGAGDDEQFGFAKEFVKGVCGFASVVFGLEKVVKHVIPTGRGLFAMVLLWFSVAAIVIGVGYFEFAALAYASLDKAIEFLDAGRREEVENAVEAARFKPDPQRDERGVCNLQVCKGKNDNERHRRHIMGHTGLRIATFAATCVGMSFNSFSPGSFTSKDFPKQRSVRISKTRDSDHRAMFLGFDQLFPASSRRSSHQRSTCRMMNCSADRTALSEKALLKILRFCTCCALSVTFHVFN